MIASVIIPARGRWRYLEKCLDGFANCQVSPAVCPFEIVIAVDTLEDDVPEKLAKYKLSSHIEKRVLYRQYASGCRITSARNIAMKESSGKITIGVESDVVPREDFMMQHITAHLQDISQGVEFFYIGPEVSNPNWDINTSARRSVWTGGLEPLKLYAWGRNWSVQRKSIDRVGFQDERYDGNYGFEDIDWAFDMEKNGVKVKPLLYAMVLELDFGHSKTLESERVNAIKFYEKWHIIMPGHDEHIQEHLREKAMKSG